MSNFKKTSLLFLGSILFSLAIAEIVIRLFVPQETKRLAIYDEELGWRGEPGGSGTYVRLKDSIEVPFHYNELGFRDDEVQPRSAVKKRIVFLGDSFIENLEVPFEKTFVALVRDRLKHDLHSTVDLVALSSQGYSTAQELLALKKFQSQLQPDVAILFFYTGNDFEDNLRREFASLDSTGKLVFAENRTSWFRRQLLSFKRWLYESSFLVFYLKNVIESAGAVNLGDETKHVEGGSDEYKLEITRQLIIETKKYVEAQGMKFGLVLFTNKHQLRERRLDLTDFVKDVCRTNGISFVDATEGFTPELFFPIDEHFNVAGHARVADVVHGYLVNTFGDELAE
ncbi:MAG: SGNH/GDSL hydrolase family protein [Ignavibacteriae bacterium]|nr:SGNH/GDSL hydrolase family protein [Ignavibacteriota bacterium]